MIGLINGLATFNRTLAVLFRWLAWIFLALMTLFIVTQVFFRKVLNDSLFWPEDVSLMMMIWVAFAVAPVAYRRGAHVSLDMFSRLLPGRVWYLLQLVMHLMIIALLAVLTIESVELIGRTQIRANSIPLSMKYVYMIMPVSFVAMVLVGLELTLRSLVGIGRPQHPAARMPSLSADLQQA